MLSNIILLLLVIKVFFLINSAIKIYIRDLKLVLKYVLYKLRFILFSTNKQASLSSKVAQRMMMGLFAGNSNQRIEFVRMKGPQGKGHAEMAVTKPKGE